MTNIKIKWMCKIVKNRDPIYNNDSTLQTLHKLSKLTAVHIMGGSERLNDHQCQCILIKKWSKYTPEYIPAWLLDTWKLFSRYFGKKVAIPDPIKKSHIPPSVVKRNGGFFSSSTTTPGKDLSGGLSGLSHTLSVDLPLWSWETLVCLTFSAAKTEEMTILTKTLVSPFSLLTTDWQNKQN